ncbi:MAG: Ankyrin [Proteobacteria bacterium]|nr:Ankyrin [Pseudomonadota bacterium]
MKKTLIAMIIGMGIFCAPISMVFAADKVAMPDPTSFSASLETGDVSSAKKWLEGGLKPDFEGSRIGSGLMIGAWEGNIELMRLFLAHGADINYVSTTGESALVLAAWKGKLDVVKWLLERGAKINAAPRQWSALHYASFAGHKEVMDYLIAQGANIDARSTNGSTPLMMAIYEGREDMARILIEKGADRKLKNDFGDGGLEWAMRFGHLKIARMVTTPEEFNIAIAQPKEKWGETSRSVGMTPYLEKLLRIREAIAARGNPTKAVDDKIAAERLRILDEERKRQGLPPRAATLEITASRKDPGKESIRVVTDGSTQPKAFKVPPATFFGTPKMPPKGQIKNY